MDSDLKFFGTMIVIVFIIAFSALCYESYYTNLMVSKGYVWVPMQQGRWEIPKPEVPK